MAEELRLLHVVWRGVMGSMASMLLMYFMACMVLMFWSFIFLGYLCAATVVMVVLF